jgi:hypothetical protein
VDASVFATERKTLAADEQQERSLRVLLLDEWSNLARGVRRVGRRGLPRGGSPQPRMRL